MYNPYLDNGFKYEKAIVQQRPPQAKDLKSIEQVQRKKLKMKNPKLKKVLQYFWRTVDDGGKSSTVLDKGRPKLGMTMAKAKRKSCSY